MVWPAWLVGCLASRKTHTVMLLFGALSWLVGWLAGWLVGWLVGLLAVGCLRDTALDGYAICSVCVLGWLVGWMDGWMDGWIRKIDR